MTPSSRAPRLYCETLLHPESALSLSPDQTHYLAHVMRLKKGDTIKVFNGTDGEWSAEITHIAKKEIVATCQAKLRDPWSPHDVWLVFSPLKKARQDILLEKAAEIGITQLVPTLYQRTEVRHINPPKIHLQLIEATEQSENFAPPLLTPLRPLALLLDAWPTNRLLYVCYERGLTNPTFLSALEARIPIGVLVGPEGGIAPEEIALLKQYTFVRWVTLGRSILRSETAAITALGLYHQMAE